MTIASTALTHAVGHGAPADLPMWRRLNLIRIGYAVMGVGLAVVKWLAFLGLRYPVRLLPILVFATL